MPSLKGIRAALPMVKMLTGISRKLPYFDAVVQAALEGATRVTLLSTKDTARANEIEAVYVAAGFDVCINTYKDDRVSEHHIKVSWS